MLLYHGSTMTVRNPAISRGRPKTDFGKGFYTTTSREQAEKWANIKKHREGDDAKGIVSVYEFDESLLNDESFKTRHFNGADIEWLDFVVGNRRGTVSHEYDMVMGPVADDRLYATILLYENGILDATAAIEESKGKCNLRKMFEEFFHRGRKV